MKLKHISLAGIAALTLTVFLITPGLAANVTATNGSPYFLTIDPIGNHSVEKAFEVTGTTNLPAANDSLILVIQYAQFNPGGGPASFSSNVSIQPGKNGVNYWACNVSPSHWASRTTVPPGEYIVSVYTATPAEVETRQPIYLGSLENATQPSISSSVRETALDSPGTFSSNSPHPSAYHQPSSLPGIIPVIAVLAGIVTAYGTCRKK